MKTSDLNIEWNIDNIAHPAIRFLLIYGSYIYILYKNILMVMKYCRIILFLNSTILIVYIYINHSIYKY
jgi:hypothetical protein